MTLGNAAAARVRLIVWCRDCGHQVEPDPTDLAERYGDLTSVLDWRDRLVCSRCGSRAIDMVLTGAHMAISDGTPSSPSDPSLSPPLLFATACSKQRQARRRRAGRRDPLI